MAVSAFLWMLAFAAPPAAAHPYLVQTSPGPGVVVRTPPQTIEVGFTEAVRLEGSSLRLLDSAGDRLRLGALRSPKRGPGLAADVVPDLDAGIYTVRWVVLGDDGHTSSGEFEFGVAGPNGAPPDGVEALAATGGPGAQTQEADGPLRVALRWAGLLGAALLLGGAVLTTRLGGSLDPDGEAAVAHRWERAARVGLGLCLIGALSAVVTAAAAGAGAGLDIGIMLATSTGFLALSRLAGIVVLGLGALLVRSTDRRTELLGAIGALFLTAEALSGHVTGVSDGRALASVLQIVHLLAAGVWVGGLAVLALVLLGVSGTLRSAVWRVGITGFGRVAALAAAAVIVTGTVAAFREVQHRYFLMFSSYGRFLVVKVALVAAMLLFAGWRFSRPGRRPAGRTDSAFQRTLHYEAALGMVVLLFAATLVGVAQGRGQPLPAQRGSVLAGPALANAVIDEVAQVALVPAQPGRNRLIVLPGAQAAGSPDARVVQASLSCECAPEPVTTRLRRHGEAWRADITLPAEGIWRATLSVDAAPALAPVAMRVADDGAPGAAPVVVSSVADLSGPHARRCRSFQLGLQLAIAFLNADGGVGGRKVVVQAADDGGDAGATRVLAEAAGENGPAVAAPCGGNAGITAEVLGQAEVPVVVADPATPVVAGPGIFRLAGDPYAEGWAVGRTVATAAFVGRPDAPRRVAVVAEQGDPTTRRAAEGLRRSLALDPSVSAPVGGEPAPDLSDVEVTVLERPPGVALVEVLREALDFDRFVATFLRTDPEDTAAGLDRLTNEEITMTPAVLVPPRSFNERFARGSKLARRGDVTLLGEVAPDSGESLVYTRLVFSLFPGESPSIDGLRGYMAGKAIAEALRPGAGRGGVARRLQLLGLFSDGVVSGWSPAVPAAGSWRFFLYKATFIPEGLRPDEEPAPGRFFPEGGAWSRVATANVGLCGPQETLEGDGPNCGVSGRN